MTAIPGWKRKQKKIFGTLLVCALCIMIGFVVRELILSRKQMALVMGQQQCVQCG